MGNKFFAEKFDNYKNLQLDNADHFSIEQMIDDKLLQHFFDKLNTANSMACNPDNDEDWAKF